MFRAQEQKTHKSKTHKQSLEDVFRKLFPEIENFEYGSYLMYIEDSVEKIDENDLKNFKKLLRKHQIEYHRGEHHKEPLFLTRNITHVDTEHNKFHTHYAYINFFIPKEDIAKRLGINDLSHCNEEITFKN